MNNGVLGNHFITQIGIIVRDIEKTSQAYADFFGIEKPQWFWTGPLEETNTRYNGQPTEARAKLAFLNMGSLQLELIEPDEHPSTWREFLDNYGEGVQHIAFVVEGMQDKIAAMEAKGMPLIQKGDYTGGRYAYMDSMKELKVILELLENDK
ncbi:VOC family protein [Paenibacillus thermotolerans]|uniref:VOC family protein n=1 Tax=Paenibacillus thermotolerans TaxID=3027807 RepID=UPI002368B3CA|nr:MULTISPECIES: VOC family protein [unclassified Paenibacillus]